MLVLSALGIPSAIGIDAMRRSWMSKEITLNTPASVTAIGSVAITPVRRKTKTSNAMRSATGTRNTAKSTPKSSSARCRNAIPTEMVLNGTARNTIVEWTTATVEYSA
ncbi:hypothetical protein J7337_002254 [Fusarium musae]|uniref:Uncharacterized protein n=1 Tax=Fusarium musae TaxID=1042133 RepID=A0A9P8DP29_9HYPO|nr:hypothetical protein J7337_002254 [Fusarium musae]KAG9505287.1 hypothetical protein J7337_002254 [Fusarium musae]